MEPYHYWEKVNKWLKSQIKGYRAEYKKYSRFQRFIGKIAFFTNYMKMFTTIYPKVWMPDIPVSRQKNPKILQHEGIHLLDQQTFFGIMPKMPAIINSLLFYIVYFMPQIFAILAVLAVFNLWWLLSLLFLFPLPAPFRMIAEMRAYRRNIELGSDKSLIEKSFTGSSYYFMWPFKKHVSKMLEENSPHKEEMDQIYND